MKTILSFFAALLVLQSSAQKTITVKMAFSVIGDDYNVIVQLNDATKTLSQRTLPGQPKPLLYTDSAQINGNTITANLHLLNRWQIRVEGYQSADSVNLVMINKQGKAMGYVRGGNSVHINYSIPSMVQEMMNTTKKYIYDTAMVKHPEWINYENRLVQYSNFLQDDLEVFALAYLGTEKLPFTHFGISKMSDETWKDYFVNTYESETPAKLEAINPQTAMLTISGFGGNGKSLERYMQEVIAKKYTNLIIDLRDNSGGGAGAVLALSKYLGANQTAAGALLTNKWFQQHKGLPTTEDYKSFGVFSEGSTNDLIAMFKKEKGIILKATPAAQQYTGSLYILTSGSTASACEPFVYAMKYFKRATIVGAKTAGAMLSKIPFDMGNGYKVFLPVTDYYTIDGERLDKKGVEPTVTTTKAEALTTALTLIDKK